MAGQWEIKGKTFMITGGASGLGALYAEESLKEGAKKVAILDISEDVGETTKQRLNNIYPNKVCFVKCDVSREEDIDEAFKNVLEEFKQIDVVVNNAGIMSDAPTVWRKACDVNLQGLVSFTMKGLKHMRKDEGGAGGTIVNISSTAAINKWRYLPIYSGAKMAVLHFSHSIAVDPFYEETGVRILTLCPGPTATPLLQGLQHRSYDRKVGEELVKFDEANSAIQPYQKPESAAAAFIKMFKEGGNGSTWLTIYDKPGQDITPVIDAAFKEFEKLVFPS